MDRVHRCFWVEAGTALQRPNESLVPWIFMCNSNRVGVDVNTQFFWCVDGPPSGFWTSVPFPFCAALLCTTFQLGRNCFLTLMRYGWSDVASQFVQECISRLDAGKDARSVRYSLVRERAPSLPWAYPCVSFASV